MRVASLFSGAGGLDLGLQQAGHRIIFQCEIDPAARQARICPARNWNLACTAVAECIRASFELPIGGLASLHCCAHEVPVRDIANDGQRVQVLRTHFPDAVMKNDIHEVEALPKVRHAQAVVLGRQQRAPKHDCALRDAAAACQLSSSRRQGVQCSASHLSRTPLLMICSGHDSACGRLPVRRCLAPGSASGHDGQGET